MPMFDSSSCNSEIVVDMKPVLIDMASVTTVETIASAREQMQDKVNESVRSLALRIYRYRQTAFCQIEYN